MKLFKFLKLKVFSIVLMTFVGVLSQGKIDFAQASFDHVHYLDESIDIIGPTKLHLLARDSHSNFAPRQEGVTAEYRRLLEEKNQMNSRMDKIHAISMQIIESRKQLIEAQADINKKIRDLGFMRHNLPKEYQFLLDEYEKIEDRKKINGLIDDQFDKMDNRVELRDQLRRNTERRVELIGTTQWASNEKLLLEGYLAVYSVEEDGLLLLAGQDQEAFHLFWEYFSELVPQDRRKWIDAIYFFDNPEDSPGHLAFASPIPEKKLINWLLAFDADFAIEYSQLRSDLPYVIIHEWAHQYSLGYSQMEKAENAENCTQDRLLTLDTCARDTSHINRFYQRFWADIIDEFDQEDPDSVKQFYQAHKDQFVTEYAATSPEEDFAETFTFFVLTDHMPSGNSIRDQKIQFMYDFHPWTEFRDHVRSKLSLP